MENPNAEKRWLVAKMFTIGQHSEQAYITAENTFTEPGDLSGSKWFSTFSDALDFVIGDPFERVRAHLGVKSVDLMIVEVTYETRGVTAEQPAKDIIYKRDALKKLSPEQLNAVKGS